MTTANRVLDIARGEINYIEQPVNLTKYGAWAHINGHPWCGAFVNWVFHHARVTIGKTLYTPAGAEWFKKQGRWHETGDPIAGDVVYFDFPHDGVDRISHVGIVVGLSGNDVVTIEGNTSGANTGSQRNGDRVALKVRKRSDIVGWGRPKYKPAPTPVADHILATMKPAAPAAKKAAPKK